MTFEAGGVLYSRNLELLYTVGLSLPWAALAIGLSLHEDLPAAARRFSLCALGCSLALATCAIVHFAWIDPALGRALLASDWRSVGRRVGSMEMHQVLLAAEGPALALVAWYLVRWMERDGVRPPRRPGSLVRTG